MKYIVECFNSDMYCEANCNEKADYVLKIINNETFLCKYCLKKQLEQLLSCVFEQLI